MTTPPPPAGDSPPPPDPSDPMREAEAEADALESAYRFLMANREGVLNFDDNFVPVKFVTDSSTGRLVMPVPVATFFVHQHVLFVPEEADDAMQIIVSPEQIDECAATDRWLAFHEEPEHVRWAMCWLESVKLSPWVFDGEALTRPNTLAKDEPALVRELNADTAALAALCRAATGTEVLSPLCVGVDQSGMHVRARFGVLRIHFPHSANDADHARRMIARLKAGSSG